MADDAGFLARIRGRLFGDHAPETASTAGEAGAPEPGGEVVDGTVAGQDLDEYGDDGVAVEGGDPLAGATPTLTNDLSVDPSTPAGGGVDGDLVARLDLGAGPGTRSGAG
ncbi:MAG TPA: hypothetical protein VF152_06235, partial [Acidimicrobiia bacterium]